MRVIIGNMLIATKDKSRPTVEVPDDDIDSETLLAWTPDRRWRSWTCPGCNCTSAGYSLPRGLALCAGCVQRRREGKELPALASVEAKSVGSSRPGRARLSRVELAEARSVREDVRMLYTEALAADVPMVPNADGALRPARCAVCGATIQGEHGRFGSTFYCDTHDWRRTA